MHSFTRHIGKLFWTGLIILVTLALLLPFDRSVSAGSPEVKPQMAPINPAFLRYIDQETAQEEPLHRLSLQDTNGLSHDSYGYVPPMLDLSHPRVETDSRSFIQEASLPSAFDWRDLNKVTPVKDQGNSGTCWAFGTEATLESRIMIVDNNEFDLSELNLVSGIDPSWVQYNANRSETGGNSIIACDTLAKMGTRDEFVQPYGDPDIAYDTVNNAVCDKSTPPLQQVTDFRIVSNNGTLASEIEKIKKAIYTYGPVSAAFCFQNGVITPDYVYDFPSDFENEAYNPNHMVCFVGWDDSIVHPSDGGTGAWIAKNSWSTDWGIDGYFYLCYGAANLSEVGSYHGSDGYEKYDATEQIYYWDEAGPLIAFNLDLSNTCWMRSVFTAENDKSLKAVAFWTTSDNASYKIYILDENNHRLASQSGTCGEFGYYTIPLAHTVPLIQGQQFKIDVKMTTPGYDYPIAGEAICFEKGKLIYQPPIQSQVNYVKVGDNDSWIDMSLIYFEGFNEDNPGVNACLRAITGTPEGVPAIPGISHLGLILLMFPFCGVMVWLIMKRTIRKSTL